MKVTTSITEPRQVERDHFLPASIVEHSEDAIYCQTLDGLILSWNAAAERVYGYSAQEAIGQSTSILIPPNQPDEVLEILKRLKQGERFVQYETVGLRKDGRQVAVSLTISPIKDEAGYIIAASTITRDISRHKRVEEALQKRTQELGERVKELNCLYNISKVHEQQELSLEQILQETINLMPYGWEFPEIACARITLAGQILKTDNYQDTIWKQGSDILVHKERVGILEVCYLEEKPAKDEGSFLKEERRLLNTIAGQLGKTIERKRTEESLQKAHDQLEQRIQERTHEIERRRQVAESLRDILTILNSNRPLNEILDYIVAQAGWLLDADASAVYRLQNENRLLSIQAAQGLHADYGIGMTIPVGQAITGQAVLKGRPVAIPNTNIDLKLMHVDETVLEPQQQTFLAHILSRYGAILAVPLTVKDKIYGAISLYYHLPREFSADEIELAITFADQAALAIENARLRAQVEQTAVTTERSRLARDLHDAVTQTLFSASLIAEMLPRVWERHPAEAWSSLEELRQLTRGALAEMRTLLLELRPAALTEAKLDKVLRHLTEAMTSRTRIPVSLTVQGECALPPDVQVALYRIAQEALNNVAKHAKAGRTTVDLRCRPERVELRISDDGCGFDPDSVSSDHLGLGIIRERARTIGAALKIESRPGGGTQIVATWQNQEGSNQNE